MVSTMLVAECRWLNDRGQPGDEELCTKLMRFLRPSPEPLSDKDLGNLVCFSDAEAKRFADARKATGH
jgi:hypothetical protein